MNQEDRLKKQIDQLGKVLGRILADILGIKTQADASIGFDSVYQELKTELDLNMDEVLDWPMDELVVKLKTERNYTHAHLELLADILYNLQDGTNTTRSVELLERALVIYEYIQENDAAYSFERMNKINRIKAYLN